MLVERIAEPHAARGVGEAADDVVVQLARHQDARAGCADLALVGEEADGDAGQTAFRSASASTICGDLPPSSSVTRRNSRAAWTAISRPTSGLPVKLILSTQRMAHDRGAGRVADAREAR